MDLPLCWYRSRIWLPMSSATAGDGGVAKVVYHHSAPAPPSPMSGSLAALKRAAKYMAAAAMALESYCRDSVVRRLSLMKFQATWNSSRMRASSSADWPTRIFLMARLRGM